MLDQPARLMYIFEAIIQAEGEKAEKDNKEQEAEAKRARKRA